MSNYSFKRRADGKVNGKNTEIEMPIGKLTGAKIGLMAKNIFRKDKQSKEGIERDMLEIRGIK